MLPFTADEFLAVFEAYNLAIWPLPIVAYALGLVALGSIARPGRWSGRVVAGILAVFWIWMGAVYHLAFFTAVNPAAWLFGFAFILQGVLFCWIGVIRNRLGFRFQLESGPVIGTLFIIYAMLAYEIIGPLFGHTWPRSPLFGVAPCPTTIFTLGVFLLADRSLPRRLVAIPLLWSFVGGSAALLLGIPEDYGLLLAGLVVALLPALHVVQPLGR